MSISSAAAYHRAQIGGIVKAIRAGNRPVDDPELEQHKRALTTCCSPNVSTSSSPTGRNCLSSSSSALSASCKQVVLVMPPDDEGRALGPPNDEHVVTTPLGTPAPIKTSSHVQSNGTGRQSGGDIAVSAIEYAAHGWPVFRLRGNAAVA